MKKEIVLSPEELYYLGSILQAEYMDYAYIASMSKYGQSAELLANEAKASLVESGFLTEDFGGNLEVESETLALVKPIFFGKTETSVDICIPGEDADMDVYKFHFLGGDITMVTEADGKLIIRAVTSGQIEELANSLLPEDYKNADKTVIPDLDENTVTRVIVAKSIKIDEISVVNTYLESDNIIYRPAENGGYESMTKDSFINDFLNAVKGE